MALWVQKFGGTSLMTPTHIHRIADYVAKTKRLGHKLVVVVSAMGLDTDTLVSLAQEVSPDPDSREYAALLSTGEMISMSLLSMALIDRGIKARSYTGIQAGIQTIEGFKKARIAGIDPKPILDALEKDYVVVVAGFQGVDTQGNITILGRGGSDTTAVALASVLKADECQIYTDVDGVYTADPRLIGDATRLEHIASSDMLELASSGAQVLHMRSVELAHRSQVPLRVISSQKLEGGTLVTYDIPLESKAITGLAVSRGECHIRLSGQHKDIAIPHVLEMLEQEGIAYDMVTYHSNDTAILECAISQEEYRNAMKILKSYARNHTNMTCIGTEKLAKLALVGVGLKSHDAILSKFWKLLSEANITIYSLCTSEIRIAALIDEAFLEKAATLVHEAFAIG
jgi:aspartate kinase